jgi:teichoic acid transport system permease protein
VSAPTDPMAVVAEHGLHRIGGRPGLVAYTAQLWSRRWFGIELARARFRAANDEDRLGMGWTVLKPLINAAVYGLIFGFLLPSSTRPDNFVAYLVVGVFFFQYFSSSLNEGARSITGNRGLVRSLHFPRALLPMSTVLQNLLALGPMLAVLLVLVVLTGEAPRWTWLLVPFAIVLMTLFNAGVALVAARLTIHVRDIAQLLPFVTRVFFYTSGIFFSVDRITTVGWAELLLRFNPVHVYINLVRSSLIEGQGATWVDWAAGAGWAVVLFVGGYVFSWRGEERYGRD